MLLTNHVLSGALIGALARRPGPAFAAGIASHFVLDAIPHWGDWESKRHFVHVATRDGLTSLAIMGTLTAAAPADRRLAVLAGMAGAALPDADKPTRLWFGWSPWPSAVDRFHSAIQHESRGRAYVEFLAGSVLIPAALIAIRRCRGSGSAAASTPARQAPSRDRLDVHLSRLPPAQMNIDPVVRLASRLEFRDERCRLGH